ncbi:hypothetical protein PybrP1_005381 [[Pythium] brassicae (nom. inval.)]|nr:hypothetical protein PybrP1_005381 [[Pythium] brassicae (nom. inval.)]
MELLHDNLGAGSYHHQQQRLHHFLALERQPPQKPPLRTTNDIADIAGAKPLLKNHVFVNKPHFYDAHDIRGSVSKELHPKNRCVGDEDRFKQLPIEGSTTWSCSCTMCWETDRAFALYERVKLTAVRVPNQSCVQPAFARGTSSKKKVIEHPRDAMKLDDIPGSQVGWLPRNKRGLREKPPRDILDVADIINVDFKSSRITNVLNPVYTINGKTHQDDEHSHPVTLHRKMDKPSNALRTSDIDGASCSDPTKAVVAGIVNEKRRHFRAINATEDIIGARADTLLHSIRSNRRVDPNAPSYTALNGQHIDSSAVSVGRSIVFADLIRDHDAARATDGTATKPPHVVAGVGNVGLTGIAPVKKDKSGGARRSTAPTPLGGGSSGLHLTARSGAPPGNDARSSSRLTPAEKHQIVSRQEDIRLVRELS